MDCIDRVAASFFNTGDAATEDEALRMAVMNIEGGSEICTCGYSSEEGADVAYSELPNEGSVDGIITRRTATSIWCVFTRNSDGSHTHEIRFTRRAFDGAWRQQGKGDYMSALRFLAY
jgi:hypothetical protein